MAWMKIAAAARLVDCHPDLLYAAIKAGRLRVARIGAGRNMRTCDEWIDEWVRNSERERHYQGVRLLETSRSRG